VTLVLQVSDLGYIVNCLFQGFLLERRPESAAVIIKLLNKVDYTMLAAIRLQYISNNWELFHANSIILLI
jgi:hypothetical protein